MLPHRSCTIALAVMLFALSPAQAADEVTLTCQGTASTGTGKAGTTPGEAEISMGIIVNFTKGTVHVHDPDIGDMPINIRDGGVTEVTVSFFGVKMSEIGDFKGRRESDLSGHIDRVTGNADIASHGTNHLRASASFI